MIILLSISVNWVIFLFLYDFFVITIGSELSYHHKLINNVQNIPANNFDSPFDPLPKCGLGRHLNRQSNPNHYLLGQFLNFPLLLHNHTFPQHLNSPILSLANLLQLSPLNYFHIQHHHNNPNLLFPNLHSPILQYNLLHNPFLPLPHHNAFYDLGQVVVLLHDGVVSG